MTQLLLLMFIHHLALASPFGIFHPIRQIWNRFPSGKDIIQQMVYISSHVEVKPRKIKHFSATLIILIYIGLQNVCVLKQEEHARTCSYVANHKSDFQDSKTQVMLQPWSIISVCCQKQALLRVRSSGITISQDWRSSQRSPLRLPMKRFNIVDSVRYEKVEFVPKWWWSNSIKNRTIKPKQSTNQSNMSKSIHTHTTSHFGQVECPRPFVDVVNVQKWSDGSTSEAGVINIIWKGQCETLLKVGVSLNKRLFFKSLRTLWNVHWHPVRFGVPILLLLHHRSLRSPLHSLPRHPTCMK